MKKLLKCIEELNSHIIEQNKKLQNIEKRIAPLEKLNVIEQHVEGEQVEISDIKDFIDKIRIKRSADLVTKDGLKVTTKPKTVTVAQ